MKKKIKKEYNLKATNNKKDYKIMLLGITFKQNHNLNQNYYKIAYMLIIMISQLLRKKLIIHYKPKNLLN